MRRRLWPVYLLVPLDTFLAEGISFSGNVIADQVPAPIKDHALPLFIGVTVAAIVMAVTLTRIAPADSRPVQWWRRGRWHHIVVITLLVGNVLSTVATGVLNNVVAANVAEDQKLVVRLLLAVMVPVAISIAVVPYLIHSALPVEIRNRRTFVKRLQDRYRDRFDRLRAGVVSLIPLGIEVRHEADGVWRVSPGTSIGQVYDAAGGRLLILGTSGAGKTTQLVELALELLRRARADERGPLPVIFDLATWKRDWRSLDDWLVAALRNEPNSVHASEARRWVSSGIILPLLDGLDEVEDARHEACVGAINAFQVRHPDVPLVVCSRLDGYFAQPGRLALSTTAVVQPLTDAQIAAYLTGGGERLAALHAVVDADANLRDVLRTPLMLRLVTQTYAYVSPNEIPPVGDHDSWVQQLFQDYVRRMLQRQRQLEEEAAYAPEEIEHYLAWLAWQMRLHGLKDLYLWRMQPDWLPDQRARRRYEERVALFDTLSLLLGAAVVIGLLYLLAGTWGVVVVGVLGGFGQAFRGSPPIIRLTDFDSESISPVAALRWSWNGAVLGGLTGGVFGGLGCGLVIGLPGLLLSGGPAPGEVALLLFGSLFGLLGLLLGGTTRGEIADRDSRTPDEAIRRSLRSSRAGGLLGCLMGALVGGLLGVLFREMGFNSLDVVWSGLLGLSAFAVIGGLLGLTLLGGRSVVKHRALRRTLQRAGLLPRNLVPFLDYCAGYILLDKVGGGYRFIHDVLRDYFADLYIRRQPVLKVANM